MLPALAGCVGLGGQPLDASGDAVELPPPQVREFHIYVNEFHRLQPYEGKDITAFAFGLSPEGPFTVPGPEIRVTEGDTVRVWLHSVGVGHTIHWHGLKVPWAMDGVPFMTQTVAFGETTYLYEFVANETGTYWYHCHVEAPSHVDAGLFGAFIVEPRDPAHDPPFDREATLMLHEVDSALFAAAVLPFGETRDLGNLAPNPFDAAEDAQGSARATYDIVTTFVLPPEVGEPLGGQGPRDHYPLPSIRYRPQYDTFMINGKSFPETEPVYIKSGETLRIRLINAGQLVHSMHLHGTHFLVTHKDGYLLPEGARYWADTLLIGPAERYDIYVEGDNPGIWDLHDHGGGWNLGGYASNEYAFPGGMATMLVYEDFAYAQLPQPEPGHTRTAKDYVVFAPSYRGHHLPHDRLHRTGGDAEQPSAAAPGPAGDAAGGAGEAAQGHGRGHGDGAGAEPRAPRHGATSAQEGHGADAPVLPGGLVPDLASDAIRELEP